MVVMSDDDVFSMEKVAKTWTSNRVYNIVRDGKVVLKLKDEDDAKLVLDFLNKECGECGKKGSKSTSKKSSVKKGAKKSTGKKSTGKKSSKKS